MAFADRLEGALRARGFEPLLDRTEIYAFEDWWKRIVALIGRADTVVFILSPDAVSSEVTLKEIAHAASLNKRFAPIVYRHVNDGATPETLRRLNFIFFDDPARFDASADELAKALQTDIGWIRQHTEYGEAARRWLAAGRPAGLLLRSPILEVAEHWIASRPGGAPEPTEETQTFITESRQWARSAQRRRRLVQVVIYVLLFAVIAGLFGWINQAYLKEQWTWFTVTRPYMLASVRPYVLTAAAEGALKSEASFKECAKDCPEMIVVPAGSFTMGSPAGEQGRFDNEGPQHQVTIARSFAVSKSDVTFADWDACVAVGGCPDVNDSGMGRGTKPVINVNWDDALQYAAWLSKMTGKTYRLLSEAEWEYAARAGTTTAFFWGGEVGTANANCNGCDNHWGGRETSPVESFKPNAFGLDDMAGNVWQWVQDCYHDDYSGLPTDGSAWTGGDCSRRVVRAGSWYLAPRSVRSAYRFRLNADNQIIFLGFRVGRTLSP